MKYQQVSVDLVNMMMTAFSYLALAGAAWILLRLLQACFWLPRHFRKQNDVQRLLQDKVDCYEKYLAECEARDKLAGIDVEYNLEGIDDETTEAGASGRASDKWRKQRESLEMLKSELDRVRDGVNVTDWDYLLEESRKETIEPKDDVETEFGDGEDQEEKQAASTVNPDLEKEESEGNETDGKKNK